MCKKYKANNRVAVATYNKEYKTVNKVEVTAQNRIYYAQRRLVDPVFRIKANTRARIAGLMRNIDRPGSVELLSCEYEQFIEWLTYQFDDKMTLDNYGAYWHLDHIKPCASFDVENLIEQKQCFHWSNIRPCEKNENREKEDKIDEQLLNWHKDFVGEFITTHPNYSMANSIHK